MADLKNRELQTWVPDLLTDPGGSLGGLEDGDGNDVTNRVVERGSNSDGEWVRLADGTQICHNTNTGAILDDGTGFSESELPGLYYKNFPLDFPAEFSANNYHLHGYGARTASSESDSEVFFGNAGGAASNHRLTIFKTRDIEAATRNVYFVAIGRWK